MPLYREFAEMLLANGGNKYKYAIPTVETTRDYVAHCVRKWPIPVELVESEKRYDLYAKTYIAIVASGTVSAEVAMLHIPTVVVYKMNPVTVWLARRVINIKWVSLVNILLNRGVYPELLGPAATSGNIMTEFIKLTSPVKRKNMTNLLSTADKMWCHDDGMPAQIIAKDLRIVTNGQHNK